MKRIFSLLLVLFFGITLASCNGGEKITVKAIAPNGSPALSQVYLDHEHDYLLDNVLYQMDVVTGADPLAAAFTAANYDFIFAPINLGTKMYNASGKYQLLGVAGWSNMYFCTSQAEDLTKEDLNGKDIVLFGQGTVPGIVASIILNGLDIEANSITYLNDTSETMSGFVSDSTKIYLIAEPSLSAAKVQMSKQSKEVKTLDLGILWEEITEKESFPQAAVFVNKEFASKNKEICDKYIELMKESTAKANSNVDDVAQMAVDLEFSFPLAVLKGALANSNLSFVEASEAKEDVEFFINKIIDSEKAALVGGKLPDSGFYYGN